MTNYTNRRGTVLLFLSARCNPTNAEIQRGSWPALPVFELLQRLGSIEEHEMYRTFNMGVGMIVVCAQSDATSIKSHIEATGESCYEIGRIATGNQRVTLN